jgi:predicted AlkP superfamily pyrophosphatase or phosphodiesterase
MSKILLRKSVRLFTVVVVLLFSASIRTAPANDQYVVVISIDGFGWEWYWKDPMVRIPTIRALAREGAVGPMEVAFPSVTWVSHTSMMTGAFPRENGVTGNSVLNRHTGTVENLIGDDIFNKDEFVKVDTIYDLAKKQRGLKTAAVSWPLTRGSRNLDFIIPESYNQATYIKTAKPSDLLDKLEENAIAANRFGPWSALEVSDREDWLTAEAANYLIRNEKPQLMLIHFLVTDSFSHLYGAGSEEAKWAHEYVDDRIRSIVDTLKAEGIFDRTNLFIVSDHGWTNITKAVKPNVLLKTLGLLKVDKNENIVSKEAYAVMNHGAAHVYVLNKQRKDEIVREIKPKLAALEGINNVYDESDFNRLGLPSTKDPYMADLILEAKEGYYIVNEHDGISPLGKVTYVATHGHDPARPWMKGTLIAAGPGIKTGVQLADATVRDLAPTIAQLLGLQMPATWPGDGGKYRKGRALTEILK